MRSRSRSISPPSQDRVAGSRARRPRSPAAGSDRDVLVHAQALGLLRLIKIEADDVAHLLGEWRVGALRQGWTKRGEAERRMRHVLLKGRALHGTQHQCLGLRACRAQHSRIRERSYGSGHLLRDPSGSGPYSRRYL